MNLLLRQMVDRLELAKQDSDTAYFYQLLYAGEMVTKIVVAGLIAGTLPDSDRKAYRQAHKLVRADGIGDWSSALDELLTGPTSQHLTDAAKVDQKELVQKTGKGSWQFEAALHLDECLRLLDRDREGLPYKSDGRRWFALFAELRNKTRGHGAPSGTLVSKICPSLDDSIKLIVKHVPLFHREWAYLHRNLSGKYRVTQLSESIQEFNVFKSAKAANFNVGDGVYVYFNEATRVDLIYSDSEAADFFFPNGHFKGKSFEAISYTSGLTKTMDAAAFLAPATDLPISETQGLGLLDIQGKTFGNLPPIPLGYVSRPSLERELTERLSDERHPVITLLGRGGIGKTWLALSVLHALSSSERYGAMFWFSARDIDLLPEGPKLVRPHLLSEKDIAQEFARLLEPSESHGAGFKPATFLSESLLKSPLNSPLLFVFDNFETVQHPTDLYAWLNTYIRLPNKILITTRFRDFKGDYPVEVFGMLEDEADKLIETTAEQLGITGEITQSYRRDLFRESEGHPYVIKVLLGEVAKAGKLVKIERIVASKEEILEALFERTYNGLTPLARQVFLTLSSWRSTIPQLAIEAVMMRTTSERLDIEHGIEELRRSSFIEAATSEEDNQVFLTVPLVASVFGRKKLSVSPMKPAVQAILEMLLFFGAGKRTEVRHGIEPRVQRLFRNIAEKVTQNPDRLQDYLPMLQFVAQRHNRAWLLIARLYEESAAPDRLEKTKDAVRHFLEAATSDDERRLGWERLANLCRRTEDWKGELHALVELCLLPHTPFPVISSSLVRWNSLFKLQYVGLAGDEKQQLAWKLIELAQRRIDEADAGDCSAVGWICLALGEDERAKTFVSLGLKMDCNNEYILRIAATLGLRPGVPISGQKPTLPENFS